MDSGGLEAQTARLRTDRGLLAFAMSVGGGVVAYASWVIEGRVTSQAAQDGFLILNLVASAVACVSGLSYVLRSRDSKFRHGVAWLAVLVCGAWLAFTLAAFVVMRFLPGD